MNIYLKVMEFYCQKRVWTLIIIDKKYDSMFWTRGFVCRKAQWLHHRDKWTSVDFKVQFDPFRRKGNAFFHLTSFVHQCRMCGFCMLEFKCLTCDQIVRWSVMCERTISTHVGDFSSFPHAFKKRIICGGKCRLHFIKFIGLFFYIRTAACVKMEIVACYHDLH